MRTGNETVPVPVRGDAGSRRFCERPLAPFPNSVRRRGAAKKAVALRGIESGYPRNTIYQKRGGRVHWIILDGLNEVLARGDEKTGRAAEMAAKAKRDTIKIEVAMRQG